MERPVPDVEARVLITIFRNIEDEEAVLRQEGFEGDPLSASLGFLR
jgi:hypothetical protein